MIHGVGQDLVLDLATEQVIGRLHGLDPAEASELLHLLHVVIRDADVADLALPHQILQRARGLLGGCVLVGPVDLVQVDVVRTEVPQARFDALPQPPAARISEEPASLQPKAALGGDEHVLPARPSPQRLAEEAFGRPEAVALRGVEESDSELDRPGDRGLGLVGVELTPLPTERPCPEGNR